MCDSAVCVVRFLVRHWFATLDLKRIEHNCVVLGNSLSLGITVLVMV